MEKYLGGGYLNKTDDEEGQETPEASPEEAQPSEETPAEGEDNFDTDDTVFYEEPTQESTE